MHAGAARAAPRLVHLLVGKRGTGGCTPCAAASRRCSAADAQLAAVPDRAEALLLDLRYSTFCIADSSHFTTYRLARQLRLDRLGAAQQEGRSTWWSRLITSRLSSSLMLRSSGPPSAAAAGAPPPPPPPPRRRRRRRPRRAARVPLLEGVGGSEIFRVKLRSAQSSSEFCSVPVSRCGAPARTAAGSPTASRRRSSCGGPRRR